MAQHLDFTVENLCADSEGRFLVFDVGELSFSNIYLHSGTDPSLRVAGRESAVRSFLTC